MRQARGRLEPFSRTCAWPGSCQPYSATQYPFNRLANLASTQMPLASASAHQHRKSSARACLSRRLRAVSSTSRVRSRKHRPDSAACAATLPVRTACGRPASARHRPVPAADEGCSQCVAAPVPARSRRNVVVQDAPSQHQHRAKRLLVWFPDVYAAVEPGRDPPHLRQPRPRSRQITSQPLSSSKCRCANLADAGSMMVVVKLLAAYQQIPRHKIGGRVGRFEIAVAGQWPSR